MNAFNSLSRTNNPVAAAYAAMLKEEEEKKKKSQEKPEEEEAPEKEESDEKPEGEETSADSSEKNDDPEVDEAEDDEEQDGGFPPADGPKDGEQTDCNQPGCDQPLTGARPPWVPSSVGDAELSSFIDAVAEALRNEKNQFQWGGRFFLIQRRPETELTTGNANDQANPDDQDPNSSKNRQQNFGEGVEIDEAWSPGQIAPKGHTIEAHGVKGMKMTRWHKTFKNHDHAHEWAEKNDAEVHGVRDIDHGELHPETRAKKQAATSEGFTSSSLRSVAESVLSVLSGDITEDKIASDNPNHGYHGHNPKGYSAMHRKVKRVAGESGHLASARKPNVMVKHYLDSTHGRHLAGRENDHEYIKRDFARFAKSYNPAYHTKEIHEAAEVPHSHVQKKIKDGEWEAMHDVRVDRHLEVIDHSNPKKPRKFVYVTKDAVKEDFVNEAKGSSAWDEHVHHLSQAAHAASAHAHKTGHPEHHAHAAKLHNLAHEATAASRTDAENEMSHRHNDAAQYHEKESKKKTVKESTEALTKKHLVNVTVSDPNHPAVSRRSDTFFKRVKVGATSKEHAIDRAKAFYKKRGYKVHDAEHHSELNEETDPHKKGALPPEEFEPKAPNEKKFKDLHMLNIQIVEVPKEKQDGSDQLQKAPEPAPKQKIAESKV